MNSRTCSSHHDALHDTLNSQEQHENSCKMNCNPFGKPLDSINPIHIPICPRCLLVTVVQAQNRAAWKTKRGFVWPCPRTRQELVTHPNKPSESRIDTLREPWIENELTGGREDQEPTTHERPQQDLAWRPEFDTIPSNGRNIFGGLKVQAHCGE